MKKTLIAAAIVAMSLSSVANAAPVPSISNLDGTLSPFGGFDWAQGSTAWTSGFIPVAGQTFTLNYAGWAGNVNDTGSGTLFTPHLDTNANGIPAAAGTYEYTIFASLTEKVISVSAGVATFQVTGGVFDIYYDIAANAKQANGTGFIDGVKIISGNVFASATNTFTNVNGGLATLNGAVTFTNAAYVNPALTGTNLTSTLQLGGAVTNFTIPTGFDFNNDGISDSIAGNGREIIFQADANQAFSTVPEPGSLALLGGALGLMSLVARRRKN